MRTRINNLLIALGAVLISTTLFSTVMDLSRSLPGLLGAIREQQGAQGGLPLVGGEVVQELKLARSLLGKAPAELAAVAAASPQPVRRAIWLPVIQSSRPIEQVVPAEAVRPDPAPDAARSPAPRESIEQDSLPDGDIPVRLVIPAIGLDAPVAPAETLVVKVGGKTYQQWKSPNQWAAGWHESSALLGQPGNTVMSGHHNIYGKVFARLVDLEPGDLIVVFGLQRAFVFQITNKLILPEKYQFLDVRMENARWILPSEDERLTLVTCWPAESNTHRLIIVARPLGSGP